MVRDRTRIQLHVQTHIHVWNQIRASDWDQVLRQIQVWDQLQDMVRYRIIDQAREDLRW